jgi:uncharacterized radical SAM superfamily Fe-S cluster-containing enzyme
MKTTYADYPIESLTLGLPKNVESICPECRVVIRARAFEQDGKVLMEKTCSKHGYFKDIIYSDVDIYRQAEGWLFEDGKGLKNPIVENATKCLEQCGICGRHTSHTAVGNIDLTNRCNLSCPVCFSNANAAGYLYEPTLKQVFKMLSVYRNEQPVPTKVIQFSGGEPTLHPKFFEILHAAKSLGYEHIQLASNGIKLNDIKFAEKCAELGLHTIYLQFDGITDDIYLKLRGELLLDIKMQALENVRKTNMRVILVPTIIKGINDHQIGDIVNIALKNIDITQGVSFQPVVFTGRNSKENIIEQRVTLSDIAIGVEEQTGYANAKEDWFPLSALTPFSNLARYTTNKEITTASCHPHCALCAFFFVDKKNNIPVPVTQFVDLKEMLTEINQLSNDVNQRRYKLFRSIKLWNNFKKYYHSEKAPQGLTFRSFAKTLQEYTNKKIGRDPNCTENIYPNMFVAGMHFMDAYNYDLERVRRCGIHYSAPDGRIYPFCSYNSGKMHREKVERRYSVPI